MQQIDAVCRGFMRGHVADRRRYAWLSVGCEMIALAPA
jgi:hypothetical protein